VRALAPLIALLVAGCKTAPSDSSARTPEPTPAVAVAVGAPAKASGPPRIDQLVIVAGGDINLGRSTGQRILREKDYDPFRGITHMVKSADLAFANLESTLSKQPRDETMKPNEPLIFTGPLKGADLIANAGFDIVSTANNHAWDYGKPALVSTMTELERVGVRYAGSSKTSGDLQYRPAELEVGGYRIAIFAVTEIWNQGEFQLHAGRKYVAWADLEKLEPQLERARRENDLVFVSYHGGSEYVDVPMTWTKNFVKHVMALGVDAVIGHHPHVPQGVGWADERPIFYSLGNLVFLPNEHRWTATSFLAKLVFHRDGRREVFACPYNLIEQEPRPFGGKARAFHFDGFTRHLASTSRGLGGTEIAEPDADGCLRLTPSR
jgi:poly-gamma-glutamate capsule biosynthesis protein CapA/YwtB (metallophosphatase superfamily)